MDVCRVLSPFEMCKVGSVELKKYSSYCGVFRMQFESLCES